MVKDKRILHLVHQVEGGNPVLDVLHKAKTSFQYFSVKKWESLVEKFPSIKPDLVLFSEWPSLSSFEFLDLFKSLSIDIPVIIISEDDSAKYAMELVRNGASDFFVKKDLGELEKVVLHNLEKKQRENEIKEQNKKNFVKDRIFKRLVEHGNDPVIVFTPQGETSYISPAAERCLGYSSEDLKELDIKNIIHHDDVNAANKYMSLCLENPGVSIGRIAARIKHKNESWRWMEASFTNLLYEENVCGIVNNFKDITAQKQAELAMKESEEKYRSFFQHSLDAILLTHPDGRIFAANPAACKIFQRTEDEICRIGRDGIVDSAESRIHEALRERNETGSVKCEINMVRKNGEVFPAEFSSAIFKYGAGEVRATVIVHDISERKRVQNELEISSENYRHLFKFNPLPNWIYDLDTYNILDVNQAAIDHYGYTKEEFLKLNLKDLRPQEEIARLVTDLKNVKKENRVLNFGKFIHKKKDGATITVEVYGYGLDIYNKNYRLVTCIDVSEKEAVMHKLKEKTEKLISAEAIAKLGYWELGFQPHRFFWSDEVYKIWGRKKEEFQVGFDFFERTIHPNDLDKFRRTQKTFIETGKALDFEHRILLPDGEIKWVHEKAKLIKDQGGRPLRIEGTVQDITQYKNTLEKLSLSEARHKGILKSQTNYLVRIDLEGRYSYVNEKFHADFSWIFPEEVLEGKPALSSINNYHHEKMEKVFKKCLQNPNIVYQVELDKLKQNGGATTTLWDFICLTGSNEEPVEIQAVGIDITDRVKAEQSLKETNRRYELVSKATSDAIYDWDFKTGHIYWGEAFFTLFGYSQNEFSPTLESWKNCVHPEEGARIVKSLQETIESSENHWEAEYRLRKANGKYSFVVEKGFILRDDKGKAFRMVGAIQDITEKKKLEELLDEASSFARIGSFEFDFEQDTLYWSPVTKEIHEVDEDYRPDYEKGMLYYKEGESRDAMSRAFVRAIEENVSYDLELQIITAKGNERWIRKIGRPTFVDGKCVRINGSFQDITNIKNSELKALKASEERQLILESIGDAFFTLNKDMEIIYWNNKAAELLYLDTDEAVGKPLHEFFPEAKDSAFDHFCQKALREKETQSFESDFDRPQTWYEVIIYPAGAGLSIYLKDVTERKEFELEILKLNKDLKGYTEELVSANKGLEQFSYIVSHNLRSPVANIIGLGDLLGQEDYPAELKKNFLQELLNNVKRLDNVVTDLNDILQVKVEVDARREDIILEDLVNSIKSSIVNLVENEEVKIRTNFEISRLHTVQSYLYSIFYNLISNSIKYRRPDVNPCINIASKLEGGSIYLTFEDNGLGFDMSKKNQQVFGLYKRFHDHVEGKGMGLFLVKTQAELLGGKISVESEVNHGTKFTLEFKEETSNLLLKNEENTSLYSH
ncbi:PAS domain S-box protein [Salinimicrobium sp. GXAS 041]|uniref:PAS domain S-box protein n=1 Tax=Salinimicrobium sp. GXAS 041 TaxID=3400806 RepID=UPI003C779F45